MTAPVPTPDSSRSLTTPAAGVYRLKRKLFVQRGADLSHACLICAKPPIGGPIVRRLAAARWMTHKATGGGGSALFVLDIIEFVVSTIWFVVDFPARRKRIVRIGFCASHRSKYFVFRRGGLAAFVVGLPLVMVGLFFHIRDPLQTILLMAGLPLFMTGIFLPWGAPKLELVSETKDGMWVEGAGEAFLKLYPALPAGPPVTHK